MKHFTFLSYSSGYKSFNIQVKLHFDKIQLIKIITLIS